MGVGTVTTPLDLIQATPSHGPTEAPEMDPLGEQDALQEAQLVEVMFDPITRHLGLLFDLRQALQLRLGNTGFMTFEGMQQVSWSCAHRATPRSAWTVVGSVPDVQERSVKIELFFVPDGELQALGLGATFYVGEVCPRSRQSPQMCSSEFPRVLGSRPAS